MAVVTHCGCRWRLPTPPCRRSGRSRHAPCMCRRSHRGLAGSCCSRLQYTNTTEEEELPPYPTGLGVSSRRYDVSNAASHQCSAKQKRGKETDPLRRCFPPSRRHTRTGSRRHGLGRSLHSDTWRHRTGSLLTINNNNHFIKTRQEEGQTLSYTHTHLLEWQVLPFQSSKHWQ